MELSVGQHWSQRPGCLTSAPIRIDLESVPSIYARYYVHQHTIAALGGLEWLASLSLLPLLFDGSDPPQRPIYWGYTMWSGYEVNTFTNISDNLLITQFFFFSFSQSFRFSFFELWRSFVPLFQLSCETKEEKSNKIKKKKTIVFAKLPWRLTICNWSFIWRWNFKILYFLFSSCWSNYYACYRVFT